MAFQGCKIPKISGLGFAHIFSSSSICAMLLTVKPNKPVHVPPAAIFSLKRGALSAYVKKRAFLQISSMAVKKSGSASKKAASEAWDVKHYSSKFILICRHHGEPEASIDFFVKVSRVMN
jgi:hypothetical protein